MLYFLLGLTVGLAAPKVVAFVKSKLAKPAA